MNKVEEMKGKDWILDWDNQVNQNSNLRLQTISGSWFLMFAFGTELTDDSLSVSVAEWTRYLANGLLWE